MTPKLQNFLHQPKMNSVTQTQTLLFQDQNRVAERTRQMWTAERQFWSSIIKGLKIGSTLGKLWGHSNKDSEAKEDEDIEDKKKKKRSPTMKDLALPSRMMSQGNLGRQELKKRLTVRHGGGKEVETLSKMDELSKGKDFTREEVQMWDPKARNLLGPKFHKYSEIGEESMNNDQFVSFLRETELIGPDFKEEDAHQLFHLVVRRNRITDMLSSTNNEVNSIGYSDFEALLARIAEMKGGYSYIAEACARDSEKDVISIPTTRRKLRHIYDTYRGITKERFLQGVGPHSDGDFIPNKSFEALQDNHMVVGKTTRQTIYGRASVSSQQNKELMTVHDFIDFCNSYKLFSRGWTIADVYYFFAKGCGGSQGLDFEDFLEAIEDMAEKRGLTTEMLLYSYDGILAFIPNLVNTKVGKTVYPPEEPDYDDYGDGSMSLPGMMGIAPAPHRPQATPAKHLRQFQREQTREYSVKEESFGRLGRGR